MGGKLVITCRNCTLKAFNIYLMFKLHTAYNNITEVNKNRCGYWLKYYPRGSYLTQYNNNNGCADKSSALKVTLFLLFYTKKTQNSF